MAVELRVATARDVDPEVEVVGGFEDVLIVVGVEHIAVDKLMRIFKNLIDIMT